MYSNTEHSVLIKLNFNPDSGSWIERFLFANRLLIIIICLLTTIGFSYQAININLSASYERTLPSEHFYIHNLQKYVKELGGSGNVIRIAVSTTRNSIFYPEYLEVLRKINDEVYLYPGVDRSYVKSLWMSSVRWVAVTKEGLEGGPVMPNGYDGSSEKIDELKANIELSGKIGQLVAKDYKSSIISLPFSDIDHQTGKQLDYSQLNKRLEQLRNKYQTDEINIHIVGFAKVMGDLIKGLHEILLFFAVSLIITTVVLFWFTRCFKGSLLVVTCSLLAVVWLLGILVMLGYELNPYSILVPFLIFAIAMSHGAQKMNGIAQDIARNGSKLVAARLTFRRLFLAGLTALISDAFGFAILSIIKIPVIQDLAITASIGVAVIIFTNLVLLPILFSYVGINKNACRRANKSECLEVHDKKHPFWKFLILFTKKKGALIAILMGLMLAVVSVYISRDLKIGDLNSGAPELRSDSQYNLDNDYIINHYTASSDLYTVMIPTPAGKCAEYSTLLKVDALESKLRELTGVESTLSFVGTAKHGLMGFSEGNPKWFELSRNQNNINVVTQYAPRETLNAQCSFLTIQTYLKDHKADTLEAVSIIVEEFAQQYNSSEAQFLSAAGNAGVEAATNIVVREANRQMLVLVYIVVILLAYITFRTWRGVICAILPLMLTSVMCEALMVFMDIGIKVATLPVVALGVGIGVDYSLYILTVLLAHLKKDMSLSEAYYRALTCTGRIVVFTGVTLSISVSLWFFSPIKYQADMGILLAFMFLVNMLGSLILLPSLAFFLLRKKL